MENIRGQVSLYLLKNSAGKPDFLFTLLTYSFILLVGISLFWVALGIPALVHASKTEQSKNILAIMANVKSGLIALAGLVFGLAGSYTVRRYKHDQLVNRRPDVAYVHKEYDYPQLSITSEELTIVENEEDI